MNDLEILIKKRTNHIFILLLIFIMLLSPSCSAILAPRTLHVEGNYNCDAGYLLAGSSLCYVQLINKDTFDWHDVTIVLNDNYNYSVKIPLIKADETYRANLADFIISDGTRFDIKSTKPLNITVKSKEGIYQGEWE